MPIIPITITGSRQVLPPDSIIFRPGPIEMYVDAPIPTDGLTDADLEPLMESVYNIMAKHFREKTETLNVNVNRKETTLIRKFTIHLFTIYDFAFSFSLSYTRLHREHIE